MMTKWPQEFWRTKPIVVMVILVFASNLVVGCDPASPEFSYMVRVRAEDTDEAIPEAEVKIEVFGKAPLSDMTDADGYARIFIDSSYARQPGKLIVKATGYERCEKHIDLTESALPKIILLQKESVAASPSTTPIMPLSTPITPTPRQLYPAPVLVNPAYGATIIGETLTNFSWQWDRALQEGEWFDLRIWRPEKPCCTVAMPYENSYLLDAPPDGFGHYLWQVAVVRIDESGHKSPPLCESSIWPFVWSDVPPTATPTDTPEPAPTVTPMPISTPDAVVNEENLNLRFGPDTVYDVLAVLKRGDPLKVTGRNLDGDWLKVITTDGQEGWVACSLLQVNVDLAGVPMAQAPPMPTPMYTPTPTLTPTPELLPPPVLLEPENGAAFIGGPVILKWQWDRLREPNEIFSLRMRKEGEMKICHHAQVRDLEYWGDPLSYCTEGKLYWGVTLVRELCTDCPEEERWQTVSEPSKERWIYYTPGEEPWTWPTPDSNGDGDDVGGGPWRP